MSLNASFSSFSPSRADGKWANFVDDFKKIKSCALAIEKNAEKSTAIYQEEAEKAEQVDKFEKKMKVLLQKKQKEIFALYEEEGLYLWHMNYATGKDELIEWNRKENPDDKDNISTDRENNDYLVSLSEF